MATFYIQLENRLLQISGELTTENISKALGYVPVDSSTMGNYATKDEVSDLVDMSMVEELSQRVDNITFDSLKDNPFLQDGSGELNIVDEAGNIIAKVNAEGIHSVDFIAGEHRLSNKTDKSYVDGALKNAEADLTGYVNNIDFYNIKNNPIIDGEENSLTLVDENSNIGLKVTEDGLYVKDVIAAGHILSQKADKSDIPSLDGYATEGWVVNQKYLTEHQDISHLATKDEIPSIDHLATKDEVSSIDFYNINNNPIVNNGDDKLLFVDENGYIGLQLEENGLYVKDVIADGHTLSQKADKSELSNYATKDEVSDLVDMSVVEELQGKVNTLVGEDSDKSVRTIANEELAAQLIPGNADKSLNELKEIAAWIQQHPEDASAMNKAIQANTSNITKLDSAYKEADVKVLTDANEYTDNINFYTIKDNPIVNGEAGSLTFVDETGYIGLKVTEEGIIAKDVVTPEHKLSDKANTSDIPTKVSQLQNDANYITTADIPSLDEYVTETELSEKGYLTEHQDISHLAEKSEIPSLDGYATEQWVEDKNYLTEHLNISHLASKEELNNLDFYSLQNNPVVNTEEGKLLFVDESGNIGLQLEADNTLYVKDVISGGHILSNKQDSLISGTNIKTINGESILGSGDIVISGNFEDSILNILDNYATKSELPTKISLLENDVPYAIDYAVKNGLYIYDIDGRFTLPDNWDTANNSKAVGVAILTDDCKFVVAKEDVKSSYVYWGGFSTDISTLTNYTDAALAATDFDGVNNTSKIISAIGNTNDGYRDGTAAGDCAAYTFPNGKTGYLGAAGEWQVARQNKEDLNSALTLIGGTTMEESAYWTSTEYSSFDAWVQLFSSSSDLHDSSKARSGRYGRAFLALERPKPLKERVSDLELNKYTKPTNGIPKTDLASDVLTLLGKANTALLSIPSEYITETELVNKGYATASELNTKLALKANKTDLPTKVSNLTNDSNFASATDRGIDVGGLNVMDARLGSDRVYFASHAQATYLNDGRDVETAVNSIETIASEASVISSEAKVNAAAAVASVSTLSGLANATTAMETLAGQVTQIQLNKESIVDIYATIDGYDTTEIFYGTCNATSNTKTYTKIMSNVTEVGPCKIIAETNLRYTGNGNNTFVGLFYFPTGTDNLTSANTVISINGGATGVITPAGTLLIEYPGSGPINQPVDIYVGSRFSGTVKVVFDGEQVEGLTDKVNDNTTAIRQHENRLTDLGSDVSLVSSGVQALKNDVEELQQLLVGDGSNEAASVLYATCHAENNNRDYVKILENVKAVGACKVIAETDVTFTGDAGRTAFGIYYIQTGSTSLEGMSNLSELVYGETSGQVYQAGTELLYYAGNNNLPASFDIYIGARFSGTVKVVFEGGEKEVVLGLSDQVKKNTADIANNSARITALESNPSASTSDIISLYQDQILRARQLGYRSSKSESIYPVKPLVFMHISDTHTSKPNTRAIQILNYLGANGNVKFLMHTGDMLEDPKRNPPAWSSIVSAAQCPVFVTSGNHDVGNWATATSQYRTDDQFYAAFITPQINSWGLKTDGSGTPHPSGKNYYFTDFTEEKIRFIVVYEYEIPSVSTQTDAGRGARWISQDLTNWFINTLLTTPAGYGVIVAKHAPDGLIGDDRNPFNSFYKDGENTQQTFQYRDGAAYTAFFADIVQAFMDRNSINYTVTQSAASYQGTVNVSANFSSVASGVEFICYVSGHVHADNISFLQTHPKQLELNINCDNTIVNNQRSETLLIEGTRFEDAINVYSIDRNYGKIHVLRIGADYDAYGNRKDLMTINYRQ